jgi:ribokinase
MSAAITVVGSLNMDFVAQVEALPRPGETVRGTGFATLPGGKGANQAAAGGRLGGRVRMLGRVGDDAFGRQLVFALETAGVDTAGVLPTPATSSGVAVIVVGSGGQNQIVVAPGANGCLRPADVVPRLAAAAQGLLLLQLESPADTVEAAAAVARAGRMTVLLDPAPARPLADSLLSSVDVLTPNEGEALALLGRRETTLALDEAPDVARALLRRGPRSVVLKLGEKGAFLEDGKGGLHVPGRKVRALDATAAGDTFNGALAVAIAEGKTLAEAVAFANAAAAISVTRLGAQASIPDRAEVDAVLGVPGAEPGG